MLIADIDRYIALRRSLGFKLRDLSAQLRHFARFAQEAGDTHIRAETAVAWATRGPSPNARQIRLRSVILLARYLHAEDPRHEVPKQVFSAHYTRPIPYIYTSAEIAQLLATAATLKKAYPLRRETYVMLLGLIASTGLRVSEALDLRLDHVLADGVLRVVDAKFGKCRVVPLHPTVRERLESYLALRLQRPVEDDHVFLSAHGRRIASSTVNHTFRRILKVSAVGTGRVRSPRIHDLRHTFATRALERCQHSREEVGRHFVGLATYLGHADIAHTYWYLEATPQLLADIANVTEALVAKEGA